MTCNDQTPGNLTVTPFSHKLVAMALKALLRLCHDLQVCGVMQESLLHVLNGYVSPKKLLIFGWNLCRYGRPGTFWYFLVFNKIRIFRHFLPNQKSHEDVHLWRASVSLWSTTSLDRNVGAHGWRIRLLARSFEILQWDLLVNFLLCLVLKHVEMLCFYIVLAHVVGKCFALT